MSDVNLPEKNLRAYLKRIRSIKAPHWNRFTLPFFGKWLVWQGFNGRYTHQGIYRYAYDFVSTDEQGRTFKGYGLELEDYYTYGLPVRAPAPGKVVRVIDHVPDNRPPLINPHDNWGNVVIIDHGYGEFTELSHFMQKGITVKEGDVVSRGALLGYAGNSGRSPEPHIHLQLQSTDNIGAPTRPLYLSSYVVVKGDEEKIVNFGIPKEGDYIRTLEETPHMRECDPFLPGSYWVFRIKGFGNREKEIKWEIKKKEGVLWIEENGSYRIYIEEDPGMLRAIIGQHPDVPLPLYIFFLGFEIMPLEFNVRLSWEIKEPPDIFLRWPWNWIDTYAGLVKPEGFHKLLAKGKYKGLNQSSLEVKIEFFLQRELIKGSKKFVKEIILGHGVGPTRMVMFEEEEGKRLFELDMLEFHIER